MRLHWRGRLWLLLPLLAVAYVLLVLGTSRFFGGERIDLTRDHLYTLSPGTRRIVAGLKQPIDLTLYFSDRASHGLPQLRAQHQYVLHMLEDIVRRSHGRVHLTQVDPLPFSEDEDRATAAGLTALHAQGTDESIFFGLAGRNVGDGRASAIPFFLPAKEPFLEYDVARLLHDLSTRREPRVAIYSGLPIWGDGEDGNATPPWTALQQVQQLFDVQRLDTNALAALKPADAAVLVLIQPAGLTRADLGAVDRYVQAGGRLLVFVDPDSEVDGGTSSDLHTLFQAWGVSFDTGRVLLDRSRALSVQSPVTGATVRDPSVIGLTGDELNRRDPVTQALSVIDLAAAGYFSLLPGAQVRLDPLIQSTTEAMVVPAKRVREAGDPASLYKSYAPDGEHYAIAVRLEGELPHAFADDAATGTSGRKPEVILVGDTDLLSDRLWVLPSSTEGQTLMSPFANNGDFFVNAIDDLSGPSNLIGIRGRAVNERRFTRVDTLRRQADEKFKAKQIELQAELEDTEKRLAALKQDAKGNSRTAAQKAAVAQFTQRKLAIRSELRGVQRSLDADIEQLSMELKFIDILLMPILVALAGLLYGLWRMRRRASGARRR